MTEKQILAKFHDYHIFLEEDLITAFNPQTRYYLQFLWVAENRNGEKSYAIEIIDVLSKEDFKEMYKTACYYDRRIL